MSDTMPATTPPKGGWRVSTQVAETRLNGTGQAVKGMTIHFQTGYGVASTVWVANATYDPAVIRTLIATKVRALNAVSQLATDGG